MIDGIGQAALDPSASPWIFLIAFAAAVVDGFFPPMPSETIVVGAAAFGAATGQPHLVLLAVCAAAGAFLGDNLTYLLGRRIGTERFRWMHRPRPRAAIDWARRSLDRRGTALILIARYIPVGRIAVNLVAGATRFPRRRFVAVSALAAATWAAYSVLIGAVAGVWFEDNPLVGALVGIALAIAIGVVLDRVHARREARRSAAAAGTAQVPQLTRG